MCRSSSKITYLIQASPSKKSSGFGRGNSRSRWQCVEGAGTCTGGSAGLRLEAVSCCATHGRLSPAPLPLQGVYHRPGKSAVSLLRQVLAHLMQFSLPFPPQIGPPSVSSTPVPVTRERAGSLPWSPPVARSAVRTTVPSLRLHCLL